MRPSELFAQVSGLPLPVAAARFADAGVLVFPCVPGGKRPLIERGFHAATTDVGQATAWWRRWPAANIGVPTGASSGLVVVDVDVHGPADGQASFDRATAAGLTSGWALLVRTPTGGMHAYYPALPGSEQRSWQAGRAGVDFRGDGGYIIVPPSARTIEGTTALYRVEEVGTGPARSLDAGRLRDFLDPRPEPRPRPGTWQPVGRDDAERLSRWLDRQDTDRNLKLFWASCRLAEGGVPMADALDAVLAAAKSDFGPREIAATVRSAYRTVRPEPARREPSSVRGDSGERWFGRHPTTGLSPRGQRL
ncbi:MAG: bifunctional DNA primase/polymerase [Microbacterium sp.]|uniref:bifunctional DNA primase/polymerase n=1 Tax=Microbacterium sp. TaxID=51671 RepID=UPI001AD2EC84|nr:bifunctional DNA primase/polymerase [Microbacterium sp.]MBN9176962.1 bifunctional DNA primase/polymerase [Microbacterium sp.]